MRGQVLGFDYRTGLGEISGEDGHRYKFVGTEWRPHSQPRSGQSVDFEPAVDEARAIYAIAHPSAFAAAPGQPNRLVAALFALFLGTIGIHKFYIGENKAGLIMLLVAIFGLILVVPTLIMAVIAFVEAINYFMTPDDEWHQRYVEGNRAWF